MSGPPRGGPYVRTRLTSIDLLRGIVMIVMVLDHTRDFVHAGGLTSDPTNLANTTPMLFMTRWVMRTDLRLPGRRRRLSAVQQGHDHARAVALPRHARSVAHRPRVHRDPHHHLVRRRLQLPCQPAGDLDARRVDDRAGRADPSTLLRSGLGLIAAFIVIRATNLYGDPRPWSPQSSVLFSVFSFVNTTKYPVSLLYLLMTIGPALLALAWFESRSPSRVEQVVTRVGRVPLFFYLWQWVLAHGVAIAVSAAAGKAIGWYFMSPPAVFGAVPANAGFDLPVVYLCWLAVLAVLIPMSLWFSRVKARNPAWWLRYL